MPKIGNTFPAGSAPGRFGGTRNNIETPGFPGVLGRITVEHVSGAGSAPTIGAGTGAGTTPTVSVTTGSTDLSGEINVTTGTTPTAAARVVTVTFAQPYDKAPKFVALQASNEATATIAVAAQAYVKTVTATGFEVWSSATALTASTAYKWRFAVLG